MDCWSAQVHSCFSYAQVIKAYQRLVHLRIKPTEPCKCWKLLISRMDGYSWIVSIYRFRSPYLSTIYKYISKYCGCFWGLPPSSLDHHDHHDHHDGFFSPFLFSGLRTCNWAIEIFKPPVLMFKSLLLMLKSPYFPLFLVRFLCPSVHSALAMATLATLATRTPNPQSREVRVACLRGIGVSDSRAKRFDQWQTMDWCVHEWLWFSLLMWNQPKKMHTCNSIQWLHLHIHYQYWRVKPSCKH